MRRLLALLAFALAATGTAAQVLDMPVALVRLTETVNIGRRALADQIQLFAQQARRELNAAEKREVLEAMINDELLRQGAARSNIRVTEQQINNYLTVQRQQWSQLLGFSLTREQFQFQVERQLGMEWAEYVGEITDELIKLAYVQSARSSVFDSLQPPTEREIAGYYEQNATSFTNPAMVRFDHIYIDMRGKSGAQAQAARTRMTSLRQEIRSGRSTFDDLARAALDDPGYSAADFGYLLRNDAANAQLLGTEFVDAVFALELGRASGVLESNVAVHIVKLTDKRPARILSLDDPILPGQSTTVRQQVRNLISSAREQEALAAAVGSLVEALRSESEIIIYEQNIPW